MGLAWVHTSRQIKYGAVSDHRLSTILNGIGQKLLAI
jgi:hypothetical protein